MSSRLAEDDPDPRRRDREVKEGRSVSAPHPPRKGSMMRKAIRIKPHHFVDIITALGRGQTTFEEHPYGHAVHKVAASLLDSPDAPLAMEMGADDICQPCKHNTDGMCDDTIDTSLRPDAPSSKRVYNLLIDKRWCGRLSLAQGDRLTARQFCIRLREKAGDLIDIYREMPAAHTAARQRDLKAGIERYLSSDGADGNPDQPINGHRG